MSKRDRFPYDPASDRVVAAAKKIPADDRSREANYLREVAQSVRDHRESDRRRR